MSFDKNIWLLDGSLNKDEIADATRKDGSLDGISLAEILISKGSLESEMDYFAVQTTMREGVQHTLGLTSAGSFKWFPDLANLGEMDTVFNDVARNAEALHLALDAEAERDLNAPRL